MDECRKALEALLKRHIDLVNSGDAGFWDHEREPEVVEARKTLARTEAKVSGDWAEFREELSELIDGLQNDENWCNPQVMADCIMTKYPSIIQLPAPQSPNILTSLPPGKWIVTVKDEHNGSVEKFEEQSPVVPGVATSLSTDDISDFDIIRAFTSEATKRPIYDSVPKYTEEQVAIGLLSVRKYFESRQKTTPPLSGNPIPSRFELYEMFRGRSITDHAANSIAEDVRVIIAHLLAPQSPVVPRVEIELSELADRFTDQFERGDDMKYHLDFQEILEAMGPVLSMIQPGPFLANARESREDRYREALNDAREAKNELGDALDGSIDGKDDPVFVAFCKLERALATGNQIDEYIAGIGMVGTADVVERIIRKYLGSWQWFGTTVIPQEDMGRDPIKELSAIIEAEVERRVREYREALTEARNEVWRWERMHRNHSDDDAEVARLHSILERCDKALSNGEENAHRQ